MKFNYQARTKKGEVQSGTVEAPSKEAALNLLRKHGLFLTAIEPAEAPPFYAKQIKFLQRVSRKEVVLFSRQLAIMFKARVSLVESLRTLGKQTQNPVFKEKILAITEKVEGGTPLSEALKTFPKLFSSFYVAMVKSGEVSGNLPDILDYLADHLEKEYHFYSRIRGAMIYPALIIFIVIFVLAMLIFFVIPNLTQMFKEAEQELPTITKVVLGLTDFLKYWSWLLLLFLLGAVFMLWQYRKTPSGRKISDKLILRAPLIGDFLKLVYLSRFASNLSVLIAGGLPIARALKITADILGNTVYKRIILEARENVRKGTPISSVLAKHPMVFPPMFSQMTLVGERTGTLDKTLMDVVEFYQKQVDRRLDLLLAILEPALIIILGLMVAGLMSAILLPLYRLMSVY